ncbi:DMT family transporter [Sandaracinobacter sp. RS1-74]|uniref:DMT family transporter n=1 Tax=Sandaracinobacteroides sayramensis TaxID=2913411 RepID=UPI001EDA279B|nr:DMT family transporter [Sandaracinobacteroides sayramensis]MCG2841435.1 DMT family transporter [Sandaracinobacteroides sayramensis]
MSSALPSPVDTPARSPWPFVALILGSACLAFGPLLVRLSDTSAISSKHLAGDLLCLLGAGFYAGYLIVVMRLRGRLSTATLLAMSTAFSALILLPVAILAPGSFWPGDWRPLMALAVSSQLVGQGLLVFASGSLPAAVIGLGLLVQPILSATLGWLMFDETMGPVELLGAGIICAALVLVRR